MNWAKSDMGFYVLKVLIVLEKKDGSVTKNHGPDMHTLFALVLCGGTKSSIDHRGIQQKTNKPSPRIYLYV